MTKTTEVHLALSQRLNAAVSEAIQARSPFPLTYVANHLLAENADAEQAAAAYVEKHDLGAQMRAALAAARSRVGCEPDARRTPRSASPLHASPVRVRVPTDRTWRCEVDVESVGAPQPDG